MNESEVSPMNQFKLNSTQLFCTFLALTIILNLDLVVPIFKGFNDFFSSLLSPSFQLYA